MTAQSGGRRRRLRRGRGRCRVRRAVPAAPAARPGVLGQGVRDRRRRRRHLVLEPLSRRSLRHREPRLLVHLRSRARRQWQWSEKYATQPEILRYLQHVTDKHDLRRDIEFSTRVESASVGRRRVASGACTPTRGTDVTCRFYVMATGCLSHAQGPRHRGRRAVRVARCTSPAGGRTRASTSPASASPSSAPARRRSSRSRSWPSRPREMTVFQRTPNFSIPAHNGPIPAVQAGRARG